MNKFLKVYKYEKVKLFRRSNVLFILLVIYLYLTPLSVSSREVSSNSSLEVLFGSMMSSFSVVSLLVMSLFFVNSVGNDFVEGSYRKSLAIGLSKKEYLLGKLVLVLMFSTAIFLVNFLIFLIVAKFKINQNLPSVLEFVSIVIPINQILSLFCAGLFGLFFIVLFRNRVLGLVFFPFWLSIEFIARIYGVKKKVFPYSDFFPGNASYNLYNSIDFDWKYFLVITIISFLFIICIWAGLEYREEKGNLLQ